MLNFVVFLGTFWSLSGCHLSYHCLFLPLLSSGPWKAWPALDGSPVSPRSPEQLAWVCWTADGQTLHTEHPRRERTPLYSSGSLCGGVQGPGAAGPSSSVSLSLEKSEQQAKNFSRFYHLCSPISWIKWPQNQKASACFTSWNQSVRPPLTELLWRDQLLA